MVGLPCVVSSDLGCHEHQESSWADHEAQVTDIASEMIEKGAQHYPFDVENMRVALSEIDLSAIASALEAEDFCEAGAVLAEFIEEHSYSRAEDDARQFLGGMLDD